MERERAFSYRPPAAAALGALIGALLFVMLDGALWAGAIVLLLAFAGAFMLLRQRAAAILFAAAALVSLSGGLRETKAPEVGVYALSGRVCTAPGVYASHVYAVTLDRVTLDGAAYDGKVLLYAPAEETPAYGQLVSARASLRPPERATYYAYYGISCTGSAEKLYLNASAPRFSLYGSLLSLRGALAERIGLLFSDSTGAAAAMLLGEKSGMDGTTRTSYQDSGLSHLLAVSGLHTVLLAGAFAALFRRGPWQRFVALCVFLLGYSALTAFSPSVLRASVMLVLARLARPLREPPNRFSALCAAFAVILFINPYALYHASFQLSFSAALGLALFGKRFGRVSADTLSGTLSAYIGTLPAQAALFSGVPLSGLLLSPFAVALLPFFLLPAAILTPLSYLNYGSAQRLAFLPRAALAGINALSRLGSGASLVIPAPSLLASALYFAGLCTFSRLCRLRPAERALHAGWLFLLCAIVWLLS